jgi:hypothetical protein
MNPIELFEKLKRIPFLRIGRVLNLDSIRAELEAQEDKIDFYPFTGSRDIRMGSDLSPIYEQIGFGDGSTSADLIENGYATIPTNGNKYPKFNLQRTGEACPVMRKTTDDLVDTPAAVRISRMPAHTSTMPMHWHYYMDVVPNCTEIAIHIPIITNKQVFSQVQGPDGKIYKQHFGVGEIWALNTYQMHNTINLSEQTRYHLWINCYLNHPDGEKINHKLNGMLLQKVESYNGPLLEIPKYNQ